jgi:hypothetical protein
MKSFTAFLTESKKQYAFRVKLACECTADDMTALKAALDKYKVAAISQLKETPIAETHIGFEHLKNVKVSIIDVLTDYPANPVQIREMIRDTLHVSESYIMVTTPGQEANAYPVPEVNGDGALLNRSEMSPADPSAHEMVGLQRLEAMLKEMGDDRYEGTQYKGVNDGIQASKPFKEKKAQTTNDLPAGKMSPVGTHKNKVPNPGRH